MSGDMVNLANVIAAELRACMIPGKQLYKTGNMKRSVVVIARGEDAVDVVIATDYASYTNDRGRLEGWAMRAASRAAKAYLTANNVEEDDKFAPSITLG